MREQSIKWWNETQSNSNPVGDPANFHRAYTRTRPTIQKFTASIVHWVASPRERDLIFLLTPIRARGSQLNRTHTHPGWESRIHAVQFAFNCSHSTNGDRAIIPSTSNHFSRTIPSSGGNTREGDRDANQPTIRRGKPHHIPPPPARNSPRTATVPQFQINQTMPDGSPSPLEMGEGRVREDAPGLSTTPGPPAIGAIYFVQLPLCLFAPLRGISPTRN
ncbi:hypothetical protein Cflav_PD2111 [Pedosphaera parvula Ellin514]|uniref:Uncharacterized protein n=1 Tax=Pedosphaera parvula (strain Ellin514) TaxID=320771 RepID=B9XLL2_PEDPL|nr:hypothetical protein Cflav_PD2111 [Pedosphaera parvula Ellin514]